jgi:hypothetical protein
MLGCPCATASLPHSLTHSVTHRNDTRNNTPTLHSLTHSLTLLNSETNPALDEPDNTEDVTVPSLPHTLTHPLTFSRVTVDCCRLEFDALLPLTHSLTHSQQRYFSTNGSLTPRPL